MRVRYACSRPRASAICHSSSRSFRSLPHAIARRTRGATRWASDIGKGYGRISSAFARGTAFPSGTSAMAVRRTRAPIRGRWRRGRGSWSCCNSSVVLERPDVVVRDLAAAARPFAHGTPVVLGRGSVWAKEKAGQAVAAVGAGFAGETTTAEWPGDEIIPELEGTVFAETVRETEANREAECGLGSVVVHRGLLLESLSQCAL